MKPRIAFLLAVLGLSTSWSANAQEDGDPLDSESSKQAKEHLATLEDAVDAQSRRAAFDQLIALGKPAAALALPVIDGTLQAEEEEYFELLEPKLRDAYFQKLESLDEDQIDHIVRTRLLWQPYILNGGSHKRFREIYLAPVRHIKRYLLLNAADIEDPGVVALRAKLVEYAAYQTRCHEILEVEIDPTIGKLSPTDIEYADLDQPPTFLDRLHHRERTLVLIHSVAPAGASKVLLLCDEAAREIDVQEAEFVMAANEIRMLMGSIAWRADPLGCAVTRDHSNDRKDGKAKGHMSDVPGKRGFTHRNKRMGAARFGSEGAGGGQDGPSYLNSLSYSGDGHGGPLYRLARNRVGVGRRANVYTSQYATDSQNVHPCAATEDEVWMPPGLIAKDLNSAAVTGIYKALKQGSLGSALKRIEKARTSRKPLTGIDGIALRFFVAAVEARIDEKAREIESAEAWGDVYRANVLLDEALADLEKVEGFAERMAELSERLNEKDMESELQAGKAYYRIYDTVKDLPQKKLDARRQQLIRQLGEFARKHEDSIYAEAAAEAAKRLADPKSDARAVLALFEGRSR